MGSRWVKYNRLFGSISSLLSHFKYRVIEYVYFLKYPQGCNRVYNIDFNMKDYHNYGDRWVLMTFMGTLLEPQYCVPPSLACSGLTYTCLLYTF